jgi:SRSO17 transposase
VPFAWFAADEEFGQNHKLRRHLEEQQIPYCMAVPKNTTITTGSVSTATGDPTLVETIATQLKPHDWQRRACGIGSKGFRVYDWSAVDAPIPKHQYVFRRNITDGELAYFHCYNPRGQGMSELVRVIGSRWPIEECFEAAKQEAGLAQYQFRLYHAWYRHITLAMLAMAFLAVLRHTTKKGTHPLWTTTSGRRHTTGGPTATTTDPQTGIPAACSSTDHPVHQ